MIGLVADATAEQYFFPPTFASIFTRPVIGIVTKIDEPKANIDHAKNILNMAGADKIFLTSALTGKGITELSDFISGK